MKRYVVGFLFNDDKVALIQKNRPEWQKGLINGIGGHIEEGENPYEAMMREFKEETGASTNRWREYALLTNQDNSVELYMFTCSSRFLSIRSTTDEVVRWYPVNSLPENIIPNLRWLIPMAKHENSFYAKVIFDTDMW